MSKFVIVQHVFKTSGRGSEWAKAAHLLKIRWPRSSQETCPANIWAMQMSPPAHHSRNTGISAFYNIQ